MNTYYNLIDKEFRDLYNHEFRHLANNYTWVISNIHNIKYMLYPLVFNKRKLNLNLKTLYIINNLYYTLNVGNVFSFNRRCLIQLWNEVVNIADN
jgi:hypothetical protein